MHEVNPNGEGQWRKKKGRRSRVLASVRKEKEEK